MATAPDSQALRQLLSKLLVTDADLEAFCLDHFRDVHARFSGSMDRVAKINLLIQYESAEKIAELLRRSDPERFDRTTRADPFDSPPVLDSSGKDLTHWRKSGGQAPPGGPRGPSGPPSHRGETPEHRGMLMAVGLGLLLLMLLGSGLLAGSHISGQGHTIWWLLSMAAFALLATAVSAGIGGSIGVWQSRGARLVGPPAVFVVIFGALMGATRVMSAGKWQVHGQITGLPSNKDAEVHLGQCHPEPVNRRTGKFTISINSDCDAFPLPLDIIVADCATQSLSLSREDAQKSPTIKWHDQCGVTKYAGQFVAIRDGRPVRLPSKVQVWLTRCPDQRDETDDRDLFKIDHVSSDCQNPPYKLSYRLFGTTPDAVPMQYTVESPAKTTDIRIEIPLAPIVEDEPILIQSLIVDMPAPGQVKILDTDIKEQVVGWQQKGGVKTVGPPAQFQNIRLYPKQYTIRCRISGRSDALVSLKITKQEHRYAVECR